ncbi:hypothetical protein PHAVU_002G137700 [Phaseolus vulgaris]|uniref:Uncharacterized protein n=1 Tax=Phaseolus vulgaris TaxID=3885 RepID=V7CMY1_PHAVU|nr:hypothetical protein PHAVU_002G137700g [Phaseolus vulgaris]ESW30256.1 hypothetical protein PHAVU_002G137700g [Phaseolus vulgaris]
MSSPPRPSSFSTTGGISKSSLDAITPLTSSPNSTKMSSSEASKVEFASSFTFIIKSNIINVIVIFVF